MDSVILNKLETDSIRKLLWEYSVPAIIGSLVIALYNLIDSIYIGHGPGLGDHALGGLGIVLPVMTLIMAVGSLVGVGAASRISICLGMHNKDIAENILGNAFSLIIALTGMLVIFICLFLKPVLFAIGATEETYPFAQEFLLFYLPGSIFFNLSYTLTSVMRASGFPKKAMFIMFLGVVINILIAPVFIFIFRWGMKGAAIATSLSAFLSLFPSIFHFMNKKNTLQFRWNKVFFESSTVWSILSIGFSPFIIQLAASVVVFFINNRLRIYGGSVAIEAYTIINRLTLIIILIISGLSQGIQPIIGYNFGAGKIDRVTSTVNYSIKIGILIGAVGLIFSLFLADMLIMPFNPAEILAAESSKALKLITLMLPLSGIQMVISGFFQSIGMPVKSILLSLTRQFLFLVPALFILPYFFDLNGVWLSIPVSDFVSTVLAIGIYKWQMQELQSLAAKNYF